VQIAPELLGAGGAGVLAGIGAMTAFYRIIIRPKDRHLEKMVDGALAVQQAYVLTLQAMRSAIDTHDDDMKREHAVLNNEVKRYADSAINK
jgi:hypothetical protein